MMCKHEFVKQKMTCNVDWCYGCNVCKPQIALESDLTAARAELAEEKEKNKTAKFAGQTWVTFDEHMKALKKIKQMEDAIKFDFERFMEFQRRAEQAEAQCAAMRLRFEKYVRENCKLIRHSIADGLGKPDDVDGKCGGYAQNGDEPHYICQECVAAYDPEAEYNEKIIDAGSALLAELQRYREAASSSAQRVQAAGEQGAPFDEYCPNPDKEG